MKNAVVRSRRRPVTHTTMSAVFHCDPHMPGRKTGGVGSLRLCPA